MFKMNKDILRKVIEIERRHTKWRSNCLNMIAAENVSSPSVRKRLSSDFGCRYVNAYAPTLATDWKAFEEVEWYEGLDYIQEVERLCHGLLKKLFNAKYADYRPISGSAAILANWLALTDVGDTIVTTHEYDGGHGPGWDESAVLMGRKIEHWPFDSREFVIDVEKAKKQIDQIKPKLLVFGASQILFPAPLKELKSAADEIGAYCVFDGSHVMGLLAGKRLQDPLREGALTLFGSTHKTFPGPQGGLIVSNAEEAILRKLDRTLDPSLFDNYHQHRVAALTVAIAEMLEFGEKYADQVIRNAKALGQALAEEGFTVVGAHKGFTETHQILLDVRPLNREGKEATKALSSCNIITNKVHLPGDPEEKFGGMRLGASEMSRTGMKEKDMKDVARVFRKCLIDRVDRKRVKKEVMELKRAFKKVYYSFDKGLSAY
jgi:glycine hydroxymethyltransferase